MPVCQVQKVFQNIGKGQGTIWVCDWTSCNINRSQNNNEYSKSSDSAKEIFGGRDFKPKANVKDQHKLAITEGSTGYCCPQPYSRLCSSSVYSSYTVPVCQGMKPY